jgi:hypothetical protein
VIQFFVSLKQRSLPTFLGSILASGALLATISQAMQTPKAEDELAQNGGFEESASPARAWMPSEHSGGKGRISRDLQQFRTGRASLKLQPNSRNDGQQPLAVTQLIPASAYRGRRVQFSAYLMANGGATAVLGMLSVSGGRVGNVVLATHASADWARREESYDVPDSSSVQLIVFCGALGQSGTAWCDDVSVTPAGSAPGSRSDSRPEPRPDSRPGDRECGRGRR